MKSIITIIGLTLIVNLLFGQDTIKKNNNNETDKMNMYNMKKKKPGTAIACSFIPIVGPIIAHGYAKKNIGVGILLAVGELLSAVLGGSGIHYETHSTPVYSQQYNYYTGTWQTTTSYKYHTEETHDAKYYLGYVGFLGMITISAYSSSNSVKKYNTELHEKIYNNSNKELGFQFVPTNNGLFGRLVYKF